MPSNWLKTEAFYKAHRFSKKCTDHDPPKTVFFLHWKLHASFIWLISAMSLINGTQTASHQKTFSLLNWWKICLRFRSRIWIFNVLMNVGKMKLIDQVHFTCIKISLVLLRCWNIYPEKSSKNLSWSRVFETRLPRKTSINGQTQVTVAIGQWPVRQYRYLTSPLSGKISILIRSFLLPLSNN